MRSPGLAAALLLLVALPGCGVCEAVEDQRSSRAGSGFAAVATAKGDRRSRVPPTIADLAYGPEGRQRMDLWLPGGGEGLPLVVYFHGGGFRRGDKESIPPSVLRPALTAGVAVASVNYRLVPEAPLPAAHRDAARALQTLRARAGEWGLDPARVAATGPSAGGGLALWLALHDDLADPGSADAVARESTRLVAVAVTGAQSTYDPLEAARLGLPGLESEFGELWGLRREEVEASSSRGVFAEVSPLAHLSADDPPVLARYARGDLPVGPATPLGDVVHHPRFGIVLKERMDALGLECVLQYPGHEGSGEKPVEFLLRQLGMEEG